MRHHQPDPADRFLTRRELLARCGMGMGALALTNLLGGTGMLQAADVARSGSPSLNPLLPKAPQQQETPSA